MLPELTRHIVVQKNKWEDEEEATRAASCASASLKRVKESRLATQTGAEERSVPKDGKYQADNRVGKTGARGRKCGGVGLVSRPHLLFGGIRSVTTVLKVVEEEQEGLQEIGGE